MLQRKYMIALFLCAFAGFTTSAQASTQTDTKYISTIENNGNIHSDIIAREASEGPRGADGTRHRKGRR